MTSNDDHCQYLMIGGIKKFYQQQNHPQMFLLTHNNHFYLQVTPSKKKYPTKQKQETNQKYIRLLKSSGKTRIKMITHSSDELKPIYDELWEELKFAYNSKKPVFMWNNMRRILETFNRFHYRETSPTNIEKQFEDINDQILATSLVKGLHVNSHIGYETDIDISGKSAEDLKILFSDLFEALGADKHFESYWK